MTSAVVQGSLGRLAERRPLFHSEADFQHALAWQLQLDHPSALIRLETRPLAGRSISLDLALTVDGVRTAIELKYLVRALVTDVDGERFELRAQSAHDVRRYDVVKDLRRLEEIIDAGAADVGVMVAITNDPAYWMPGRDGTIDAAFRLHEGATLSGALAWAEHAGAGTIAKRTEMLSLGSSYVISWSDYSDTGDRSGKFRNLLIEVVGTSGEASTGSNGARLDETRSQEDSAGGLGLT